MRILLLCYLLINVLCEQSNCKVRMKAEMGHLKCSTKQVVPLEVSESGLVTRIWGTDERAVKSELLSMRKSHRGVSNDICCSRACSSSAVLMCLMVSSDSPSRNFYTLQNNNPQTPATAVVYSPEDKSTIPLEYIIILITLFVCCVVIWCIVIYRFCVLPRGPVPLMIHQHPYAKFQENTATTSDLTNKEQHEPNTFTI
eukprot:TRINITY_DN14022_c0_g1_i1.p1 TRINITY_DN14022_c0_g1~~TRINITY_DN14022_c0_g1_i1.p1  ORF type:complete len:199 (+),score=17.93 TRINITY_DN14022_c0_g1_i1:86-682(+)